MPVKKRNTSTGFIKLYNQDDRCLFTQRYGTLEERENIIKIWRQLYGKKFGDLFLHIQPTVDVRYFKTRGNRNTEIFILHRQGVHEKQIAEKVGITQKGVQYILNQYKKTA